MTYEYVLKYQDYLNAQRLYIKHRWTAAIKYYLWVWGVPILGLVATVPFVLSLVGREPGKQAAVYAGLAAAGVWSALLLPFMRWYNLRRCWKALISKERRGKPVLLEFTDELVISTIPGQSEGRFFWSSIREFAQDENISLLFVREKKFLFIPTSAVPAGQWADVRSKIDASR